MQICLMIEGQENVTWEDWTGLALACQEHGFDALFRSDHYVSFGHEDEWGSLDAWGTLCALAARTERIHLGTLVSPATFRHPAHLAKLVATADHVSGGRIELGMGAGWFEREHRAFGFPFPSNQERFSILEEQVEIVHRLWDRDEDEVTFEGRHYRLEACHALPKPLQDPHPNLILGGGAGSRAARLAARFADEYNVFSADPEECRRRRDRILAAFEAEGRDPAEVRFSLMTTTLVGADRPELESRAVRLMERSGETGEPGDFIRRLQADRLAGTPDQILSRLRDYAAVGVERVMMQHLLHDDLEELALIGRDIIPEAADITIS